jgi:putative membrane protein
MHDLNERGDDPTRDDLAEDRTILANERTFGSWMRTSLGCVAIG